MSNNNNMNFRNILNRPIIIRRYDYNNYVFSIFQLICANQLGIVMDFMIRLMNSYDIFNIQDDNGNTPLHLLCKNIDYLDNVNFPNEESFLPYIHYTEYKNYRLNFVDHHECFSNFSSRPILSKSLSIIEYLSKFVKFTIKNKEGKTAEELTNNYLVHKFYCKQLINLNKKKIIRNDIQKNSQFIGFLYEKFEFSLEKNWRDFFNLKDPKRNNKTFLHFLCEGDRVSAVQFLVEHGADVNNIWKPSESEIANSKNKHGYYIDLKNFNGFSNAKLYNNMEVSGKTPINFLFSTYKNEYYPSGFFNVDKYTNTNELVNNPKSFINRQLNNSEKYILKETEQIIEYLFNQGINYTLEDNLKIPIISDIMYKSIKKKNETESENNKNDINAMISKESNEQENKLNLSLLESEQIINNKEKKGKEALSSDTSNNKEKTLSQIKLNNTEEEKSKSNDSSENTNQINTSLDNTNPVKANINLPVSLWEDIKELSILSGKSVDTICWELLSSNLKERLNQARGFFKDSNTKDTKKK